MSQLLSYFRLNDERYATLLLSCTVIFLFADQNLLAPNLTPVIDTF